MAKRKKTNRAAASDIQPFPTTQGQLLEDLRSLIREARGSVAQAVNSALVLLYWQVGHRIRTEILREKRAEYGEQIVPTLSAQLAADFGDGFSRRNLFRMIRFAEVFPNQQVVTTLSRQLSWSHFIEILPLKDDLQRDFYAEMCRVERGACAPCTPRSAACFSSAPLSPKSPPSWQSKSWPPCARKTN